MQNSPAMKTAGLFLCSADATAPLFLMLGAEMHATACKMQALGLRADRDRNARLWNVRERRFGFGNNFKH